MPLGMNPGMNPESTAHAAPGGHTLKLGLTSYSMRKQPLDRVLELCRSAGIKHLTLKDVHLPRTDPPTALHATAERIRSAGIAIAGAGVIDMKPDPKKNETIDAAFIARIRADFEYARAVGAPLILATPAIEALDLLEKLVKEFNLPVAIHSHGPEDKLFPTPKEILAVIRKRDKRMGVCMDIGHSVRAGGDPAKHVLACGDRLMDVQVKDLRKEGEKWVQLPVGRGSIDIPAAFKALLRTKFTGHVALKYEIDADDPAAGIRESLGYMRGVAGALGALEPA